MKIYIETRIEKCKSIICPVCDTAKLLCKLTGRDYFEKKDLVVLRKVGYVICTGVPVVVEDEPVVITVKKSRKDIR